MLAIKNDPEHPDPRGLSRRERQVAAFLGLGQSTKAIGYSLGISEAAVTACVTTAARDVGSPVEGGAGRVLSLSAMSLASMKP